jgi:hypothetical protein
VLCAVLRAGVEFTIPVYAQSLERDTLTTTTTTLLLYYYIHNMLYYVILSYDLIEYDVKKIHPYTKIL